MGIYNTERQNRHLAVYGCFEKGALEIPDVESVIGSSLRENHNTNAALEALLNSLQYSDRSCLGFPVDKNSPCKLYHPAQEDPRGYLTFRDEDRGHYSAYDKYVQIAAMITHDEEDIVLLI